MMFFKQKRLLILWTIALVFTLLACNALGGGGNDNNTTNATGDSPGSNDLTAFWEGVAGDTDDGSGFGSGDSGSDSGSGSATSTSVPGGSGGVTSTSTPVPTYGSTSESTAGEVVGSDGVITLLFDRAATPESTDARSGPAVKAVSLSSPPVIDGDPSDWTANSYTMENLVFGEGFYADKADLSAVFQIGWDEEALYIGVTVRDTRFVQTATGSQIYRGDSLEILLDTELTADFDDNELSGDDFQVGLSPGNLIQNTNPEAYIWNPISLEGPAAQINVAGQQTDDGYTMEAKVPWSVFDLSPTGGERYGFVFSVSDNDDIAEVQQQSLVSFGYQRTPFDPTGWFNLLLLND